MKLIHIPANPQLPAIILDRDGSLSILQELVGGYIESVGRHPGAAAYVNEEGTLNTPLMPHGLPVNAKAMTILRDLFGVSYTIKGDMVIVGIDEDGEQVDVPDSIDCHIDDLEEEHIEAEPEEEIGENPDDARDRKLDAEADSDHEWFHL